MAMTSDDDLAAAGWEKLQATHFNTVVGQFWFRRDGQGVDVALPTDERHANGNTGVLHGGLMTVFADNALGMGAFVVLGEPLLATSHLAYNYLGAARPGQLLTCRPEVMRRTSSLIFVRGVVLADGRPVGSTDGVFSILAPETIARIRAG